MDGNIVVDALGQPQWGLLSPSASCRCRCLCFLCLTVQVSRAQPIREIVCDVMASPLPPSALTRVSISLQHHPAPAMSTNPSATSTATTPAAAASPAAAAAAPPAASVSSLTAGPLQQLLAGSSARTPPMTVPVAAAVIAAVAVGGSVLSEPAVSGPASSRNVAGAREVEDRVGGGSNGLAADSAAGTGGQQGADSGASGPVVRHLLELFQHLPADVMEQVRGRDLVGWEKGDAD